MDNFRAYLQLVHSIALQICLSGAYITVAAGGNGRMGENKKDRQGLEALRTRQGMAELKQE